MSGVATRASTAPLPVRGRSGSPGPAAAIEPDERLRELLPLLACPCCRDPLRTSADGREPGLVCSGGHAFEVHGGVPILLEPAERLRLEGDLGGAAQMRSEYRPSLAARVKRGVKRAIGSNHRLPAGPLAQRVQRELAHEWKLEIGSGLKARQPRRVNLDIALFPGVDVVGSALRLPFAQGSFALVRNQAVLEHVREPQRMIDEIERVLRPGGVVYAEAPFLQHFHAYPNDFQRWTVEGLKQAFHRFEVLETGVILGPGSAMTALIGDFCELFTFSERRFLNDAVRTVPLLLLWPLKFLDRLLVKNPRAHELCSGLYLLGRKP